MAKINKNIRSLRNNVQHIRKIISDAENNFMQYT